MDMYIRRGKLKALFSKPHGASSLLRFLDGFSALKMDLEVAGLSENKCISALMKKYDEVMEDIGELEMKAEDFEEVAALGRGQFGEVKLVKHKASKEIFAMKSMSKGQMMWVGGMKFFWQERDIMAFCDSPWIVQLCCTFPDKDNLHMVMEYMSGGELYQLVSKNGMPEETVRFYAAELVLAVVSLHSKGYIHQNLKPSNIMLDQGGHLKLLDFSFSTQMNSEGLVYCDSWVGTVDYTPPEVLALDGKLGCYGTERDWWSVGIIIYEMFVGQTPFYNDSVLETIRKVMDFKNTLHFPSNKIICQEGKDIIYAFLSDSKVRLGRNGVEEIKRHPFFQSDRWTFVTIREVAAPIVPKSSNNISPRQWDESWEYCEEVDAFEGDQRHFIGCSYFNNRLLSPATTTCLKNRYRNRASLLSELYNQFIHLLVHFLKRYGLVMQCLRTIRFF